MKTALFIALGIFGIVYVVIWVSYVLRSKTRVEKPGLLDLGIGAVTNFFDALGIGSFATTTALFRAFRVVPDEEIPGTLNAGDTLPGVLEAFIYIAVVEVDTMTLALMIAASVVGAWIGAGVVARWPRRKIQIGMGLAMLAAAGLMMMTQLKWVPGGGDLIGLTGGKLLAAVLVN